MVIDVPSSQHQTDYVASAKYCDLIGSLQYHLNLTIFVKISVIRFEEPPSSFVALTLSYYLDNATTLTTTVLATPLSIHYPNTTVFLLVLISQPFD